MISSAADFHAARESQRSHFSLEQPTIHLLLYYDIVLGTWNNDGQVVLFVDEYLPVTEREVIAWMALAGCPILLAIGNIGYTFIDR